MSTETKKKKKFRLPHIFVLLTAIIVVCAVATWILPAGEFDRQVNEAGTEVVVPGTYHTVDSSPVGPFETVKAIYNGMLNGGGVIFFVFIAYAAIGLIISTGAFNGLVAGLLKILQGKARAIIIPVFILVLLPSVFLKKLSHSFQFLLELQSPWVMMLLSDLQLSLLVLDLDTVVRL